MKKTTAKEVLIFVLSFAVPTLIFALCWANIGITYNGELTPLIYDMNAQYMPFMTSLRYVLNGENSIFFNWSVSLGGDYLSLFAYYLASPLNLLTVLWDVERMPQAIYVITLIKIGLCGLTFQTFLRFGLAKRKSSYVNIVFASCYALMSYNIVYSMCLMWLDGVILLPLILLGVEKLFEGKKGAVYFFSIFGCFYCNFYISYMVGIFTAVYFLTCVLRYWEKGCIKQMLVKAGRFTLLTLTALGLTLPMVLPALLSFAKGKGIAMAGEGINPEAYQFSFVDLLIKLLPQQYDSIEYAGLPSIYCGMVMVCLAFLFFFLKFQLKEKICGGILFSIPILGFVVPKIDIMLHGFQMPHCFPYRYAFIFSFCLIIMAYRSYLLLQDNFKLSRYFNILLPILCGYLFSELFLNTSYLIGALNEEAIYSSQKRYEEEYILMEPIVEKAKNDNGFYRIGEQLSVTGCNFSFLYNYPGTEYFGSIFNYPVNDFLMKVGKADVYYRGASKGVEPFSQSFLGIKYIVSLWPMENCLYEDVSKNLSETKYFLYKNKMACSVAVLVDEKNLSEEKDLNGTTYENANSIATVLTGDERQIYSRIHPIVHEIDGLGENRERLIILSFEGDENTKLYLDLVGEWMRPKRVKYYDEKSGAENTTENDDVNSLTIELDGEEVYSGCYTPHFQRGYDLGKLTSSGEHELVFRYPSNLNITSIDLFRQDESVLISAIEQLSKNQIIDVKINKNCITWKALTENDMRLITSIPYDDGWELRIDGERTNILKVFNTFASARVSKGEHFFQLRYIPKGFREGCYAALASILAIVTYFGLKRKQNVNIS